MTVNINEIFDNRQTQVSHKRTYDVRVTLNKSGSKGFVIRFGFINKAAEAFNGKTYIQMSRVDKLPNRIYFKLFDSRANLDAHKLSTSKKESSTSNIYATMTPSPAAEKIYRAKWIGKTFNIKFDEDARLYYIEQDDCE